MTSDVSLREIIAPQFYDVHRDISNNKHTHYFLKGGRGSTKSSFVSIELILGIMKFEDVGAICFRKVGADLKDSVFNQLLWAIDILKVSDFWSVSLSPLKLTYLPTNQHILFRGVDDPSKSKSIKLKKGYFKYIWFEEADQFFGMAEIRKILQSIMRGGSEQKVFYSYNPPRSLTNWINIESTIERKDRLIHKSSYLDVPKDWLGTQFIAEAKYLKETNEESYNHEYLGEVVGTGGEVFKNIVLRDISEDEIENFDKVYRGLDFGFSADPCAYVCCYLHNNKLYIFNEYYKVGVGFDTLSNIIKEENTYNDVVYADSAEPRSIYELSRRKIRILPAIKGAGSVNYGITKLRDLKEIIIDPKRCPNCAKEFTLYELDRDLYGGYKAEYPDKNNHSIDAVRYALCNHSSFLKTVKEKGKNDFELFRKKQNADFSEYLGIWKGEKTWFI